MKTKSLGNQKVKVVTLGCSKNLIDSEMLVTQLKAEKWDVRHDDASEADIVVVNTCGFIDLAKEESVNTILAYAEEKKRGNIEKLFVTGCLSERYREDLQREIEEVDAFFGTLELPQLLEKFDIDYKQELLGERAILTPSHYAYLKISEGCNRTCSFCAIPLMRKKHISKSIEDLVIETEGLVRRGAKEIILIAQELTYYGLDLYKKRALPDLLNRLADIEGLKWLRLHYAYPSKFPREIIEVMRSRDNICNYLDIPLQHASNAVLENMRRHTSMEEMQDLLDYCRQMIPDIKIRTTMLVGHPGETEEDIAILKTFIQKNEFDRLGVFQYSHEEGTRAYEMTDDVPAEEKARRANEIMEIQQMISLRKNREIIGKELEVMIDRQEGDHWYGRTYGDSPEVDNEVIIHTSIKLRIGQFVKVDVVDALEYDLIAEY